MSTPPATYTAAIIGSTGVVGTHILNTCLSSPVFSTIHTISRRAPKVPSSPKLNSILESDTTKWSPLLSSLSPPPEIIFSSLGTTRAQAGSLSAQWAIDHDLNVSLLSSIPAKEEKTFVFISSAGTRGFLSKHVPYSKMKIGVEDALEKAGFKHSIVLRPGLILGEREVPHFGMPTFQAFVRGLGRWVGQGAQDFVGQEAEVIGRAAVRAAEMVRSGEVKGKHWVIEAAEIVKLAKEEQKA